MIIDRYNRVHDYLRISITERCNLRCFYCMPSEGIQLTPKPHLMSKDEILDIAKTMVGMGIKKIRLTGGEPLVHKEAHQIIEGLGKLPIELAITTNGIIVDKFIDTFKKSGLKSVNVSLDTLDRDKFQVITRRDYFNRVLSNIYKLVDEGFKVKVNVVLIRDTNDYELIDFLELTKNINIQVRFIEFMPFSGNKWDWSKGVSIKEILDTVNGSYGDKLVNRIEDKPHDTCKNYQIDGYQGTFAIISSITQPFCSSCNRIRLTADGKLRNCLFATDETDLLTAYRNGEDITKLVMENIQAKVAERGGWKNFEELAKPENHNKNRSMVLIGG
ncbi:MAG: GTP 3',8-cyclase MoaA [Aureispira sp.]|nr:GTP 3',8-cyclase MoaA [Aureispira sp.]